MSANYRTRLTPKHKEALAMFSNQVQPKAVENPTEFELPQDEQQDEPVSLEELDQDQVQGEPEVSEEQAEPTQQADDDDSWLDELTPAREPEQQEQPVQQTQPVHSEATQHTQDQLEQQVGESDADYIARLRANFENLEHIDKEVANEILDTTVTPIFEREAKHRSELERRLAQIEQQTAYATQQAMAQRYAEINAPIIQRYPKAERILQSREFMDFVNQNSNPYSPVSQYEILNRAYQAGDSAYVIKTLDEFVASRGKPKPPINADTTATGGSRSMNTKPKRMSEQEFLAKRRAIMANPRKYKQGALRELELKFFNQ